VTDAVNLGGRGVLAQLWARERLAELRDRHALGDEPAKRKDEIVQLGLKHNLLTPFTSFVAVDTVARLAPGAADKVQRVMQPIASPAGVTGGGELVPTTPEPATVSLIVTAALVVGWGVWRERRKNRRARHE
jgi:Ca-activated chloride channel family protein